MPDINKLHDEAADASSKRRLEKAAEEPENHHCIVCDWNGDEKPADYGYLVYDVFSDDPKDLIFTCEDHDGYTGSPIEGYFQCGECQKTFAENYTWERYDIVVDCDQLCLPCALDRYLDDRENWIDLNQVEKIILDPSGRDDDDEGFSRVFDLETGTLNLACCSHLIAVEQPIPDRLHFVENLEFDSCTGRLLAGFSTTYGAGVGENASLAKIKGLADAGYSKFVAILDGAYQFSVSIGLYVDATEHEAL